MLDHISDGRLNFGIAASGLPSDWAMFNVDGMSGVNRDMTREALDIILRLWAADEPFHYEGTYWKVDRPEEMFGVLRPHIKPLQDPHPPIGVAGLSKNSDTLKLAGERGFLPLSLNLNPAYVASHWDSVEAGARSAAARRGAATGGWCARCSSPRPTRRRGACRSSSMMGRMMGEYFLPLLANFGFLDYLKHDPDVADSDVDAAYCARHNWIIGSPETVVEKLEKVYDECGGFGQILVFGFDYSENPEPWLESLGLLQEQVLPKVAAPRAVPAGGCTRRRPLTASADDVCRDVRGAHEPFVSRRHTPNPSSRGATRT